MFDRADVTGRVQTELQQRLTQALKQALPTLTSLGLQRMCEVKAMVRLLPHDNDVMIVTIAEQQSAADAVNTDDVKEEKTQDSMRSRNSVQDSIESSRTNDIKGALLCIFYQIKY